MQVLQWSKDVIGWLHTLLREGKSAAEPPPQCQLLNCFAAWVRLGCLYAEDLPKSAAEELLSYIFSSIHSSHPGRQGAHLELHWCGYNLSMLVLANDLLLSLVTAIQKW